MRLDHLTPQMTNFLARHASGLPLSVVAKEQSYSYNNVVNTVAEAKMRLGASTLAQAVLIAHERGYLSSPTGPDDQVMPFLVDLR